MSYDTYCRICFGAHTIFVVSDPRKVEELKRKGVKPDTISFEFAQKELARSIVANIEEEGKSYRLPTHTVVSQLRLRRVDDSGLYR